jgi:hypothetical protein
VLATLSNARKTGRENRIDVGGGFVIFFIVSIPVFFCLYETTLSHSESKEKKRKYFRIWEGGGISAV